MSRASITRSPPALFYGVALAAFLAEIAAVLSLGSLAQFLPALGLHLGTILLTGLWAYFSRAHYDHERFGVFLLPLILAAGPFGAGICLIAALAHSLCAPHSASPSEWIEELFEREVGPESDRLYERIALGLDDFTHAENVEPFRDILSGGTVLQKQTAAAKIARHFRPQFAPLLLQAANDSNAAVRVQAATALAKIERNFMNRYIRLETTLKALPGNDPSKLQLAELYDDYAHTGLLDENNRQMLRLKAIDIYKNYLAHQDSPESRIRLARLYLRQNQPEEARYVLKPLLDLPNVSRRALYWYMEALFRLKQFGELRLLAESDAVLSQKMSDGALDFNEIENLPEMWQAAMADSGSQREAS